MRTVSSTITNAEVTGTLFPRHSATIRNELLSFAPPALNTNAYLDAGVPQSYAPDVAGTHVWAAFRNTDGCTYAVVFDPATAANWALLDSATLIAPATTVHAMRPGVDGAYVYSAIPSGSAIQVRRAPVSGTTNPPSLSFSDYGPAFGSQLTDTGTLVRRVEAVCPTAGGIVVAIGAHDFIGALSTITFYWLPDNATAVDLVSIIQAPLTDSYSTWYSCAQWASAICAVYDSATGAVWVFAPAGPNGRTVTFSIRNGIESHVMSLLPLDPESEAAVFAASSVTRIGDLYYLAGRMTRSQSDGTTIGFDCYLTGADCERWSIGERSFYIQSGRASGTLVLDSAAHTVHYGGNLYHTSAAATLLQDAGATAQASALADIAGWSVQQIVDGADSFSLALARGNAALSGDTLAKPGAIVALQTGQGATLADFGVYGIDKPAQGVGVSGGKSPALSGRDIAGKRLVDWRAQFGIAMRGRSAFASNLQRLDGDANGGFVVKSPADRGYRTGTAGLTLDGLNEPLVAYLDAPDGGEGNGGDGLTKATVQFTVDDECHLSSFGVLIGAADDGTGNVFLLPKANNWTGHVQAKARMRRLSLHAVDQDDPEKEDTGFNFKDRTNSLWESSGARTVDASGTYATDEAPGIAPGIEYDVAVRVVGRRAQMFVKERQMGPDMCSAYALYTLVSEFVFDHQTRRTPLGKGYAGIALGTDVFVDVDAFAHAVYGDVDVALTEAVDYRVSADGYAAQFAGKFSVSSSGNRDFVFANAGSGFDMSQFAVGQHVYVDPNWAGLAGFFTIANVNVTPGSEGFWIEEWPHSLGDGTNCDVYLRSTEEYGYIASGVRERTIEGELVVDDPRPRKALLALYGAGIVVSSDNTALSYRYWSSDGMLTKLLSAAWDATWPGGAGTDEGAWRLAFGHNTIARYWVSVTYGLPAAGKMLVDDEVIGYEEISFDKFSEQFGSGDPDVACWTVVPTYYTVVAKQVSLSSTIRQAWLSGHAVGEAFEDGNIVPGMSVELRARNSDNGGFQLPDTARPAQWYVYAIGGDGETASLQLGAYDKPYGVMSPYTPEVQAWTNDLIVSSKRGMYGTEKKGHDPAAPVVYYPCDSTTGEPASVIVSRVERYSGAAWIMADAIQDVCAMAGQRAVVMRNMFTPPTSGLAAELSDTPYTLPLREDIADFTLDLVAHIPPTGNRLNIDFRGYYRVAMWQTGDAGVVMIGLATSSGDVAVDDAGDRWLERAGIPITVGYDIASSATANSAIRLSVQDNLVAVDICGQAAWTFNLDSLTDGTHSYRADTAGPIAIWYASDAGIAGNTATILVRELGGLVDGLTADRGTSARSIIDGLIQGRHIRSRATATGGIEFSQFWERDDAGALHHNLLSDDWEMTDVQQAGHVQIVGAGGGGSSGASGDVIDEALTRVEGYAFDVDCNNALRTTAECVGEARLSIREGQEYITQRQVSGYARIALQPEDKVTLAYEPPGGAPTHAETDHVITSITITATPKGVISAYTLRDYVEAL